MRAAVAAIFVAVLSGCGGESVAERVERQVEQRYDRIHTGPGSSVAECKKLTTRWACTISYYDRHLRGTAHNCSVKADAQGRVSYVEEC